MEHDFDVIVIGSGASGGTLAADLAASGMRVLVLERGRSNSDVANDERSTLINREPYDSRAIHVNERPSRLYMGSGPGGGTSVYGAALLRPSPDDFHPGKHYSDRIPRAICNWPIEYTDLLPYFEAAEQLYRVAADSNDNLSPLPQPNCDANRPPLPLAPINKRVIESTRAVGLNPFRLPLGIQSSDCLKCANCAGFLCPTGARRDAGQLLQLAADNGSNVIMLPERDVIELRRCNGRIAYVNVMNRQTRTLERYSAERYAVAAGAIGTPALLLRSGFEHPELGRNYMMHYSPLVVGLFTRRTGADRTFVKQLGFSDFYFGTRELNEKMGLVQSLPAPGPLMLGKSGLKHVPGFVLNQLRSHMLPFVGIIEDLPQSTNRVTVDNSGRISLHHRFSDYDQRRGAALSSAMMGMLKAAGAVYCVSKQIPSAEHVAHQCGTVRFGNDPDTAVVDRDCRMFGQDDLFVVDGSILPTSLGVGPAMTLIANSLRISEVIKRDLSRSQNTEAAPLSNLSSGYLKKGSDPLEGSKIAARTAARRGSDPFFR
ncbi:MAG: GMC family oxidoreductase [Planctomycetaceae bacterium]